MQRPVLQRQAGFRGGVQLGTAASSNKSTKLDATVRAAAAAVTDEVGLSRTSRVSPADISERLGYPAELVNGLEPDGGIWLCSDTDQMLVAGEAKYQGVGGNAIERWYKNLFVLQRLGVGIYITFCAGAGFFDNATPQKAVQFAVLDHFDDPSQVTEEDIWNVPSTNSSVWLYRYRTLPSVDEIADVYRTALAQLGRL